MDRCLQEHPPLYVLNGSDHEAACFLYEEGMQETQPEAA